MSDIITLATLKHHLGVMKKESADEIDISLEAVAGMEQMLNDLLDYFRLDNGKETIIAKPFTVKGLEQGWHRNLQDWRTRRD